MNRTALSLSLIVSVLAGGCASKPAESLPPIPEIPPGAVEAKEGTGRLFFQSTDAGTIYVYDPVTTRIVFTQYVRVRERFVLDPALDLATVEGKAVYEKPLDRNRGYRLYFLPGGPTTAPTTRP